MADLGSIGRLFEKETYSHTVTNHHVQSADLSNTEWSINGNVSGTISGIIKINDVVVSNVRVALIYRSNMLPLDFTFTDGAGAYSFSGLNPNDIGEFMVIAIDPQIGSPYNYTIARDHLTPG